MSPLLIQLIVFGLVFGAIVLAGSALLPLMRRKVDMRARLALPAGPGPGNATLRTDNIGSNWARLVGAVERFGVSLADSRSDAVRDRLISAGYPQPWAPRLFVLARTLLTLGLPLMALGPLLLAEPPPTAGKLYMWILGLAVVGLYVPNLYVDHRITKRQEEMRNGFPDTLDLMLVCVEAGLGIDACFARVGAEIRRSHPLLAAEFEALALELRAGRSREDALRGLARRAGLTEITAFVTLLVQAQKLGSSIAQALRIYSIEMREGRRMRAEEKAHRLPVLLSIPLVVFMLPTMMSVLMLPGIIMIVRNILPGLAE